MVTEPVVIKIYSVGHLVGVFPRSAGIQYQGYVVFNACPPSLHRACAGVVGRVNRVHRPHPSLWQKSAAQNAFEHRGLGRMKESQDV